MRHLVYLMPKTSEQVVRGKDERPIGRQTASCRLCVCKPSQNTDWNRNQEQWRQSPVQAWFPHRPQATLQRQDHPIKLNQRKAPITCTMPFPGPGKGDMPRRDMHSLALVVPGDIPVLHIDQFQSRITVCRQKTLTPCRIHVSIFDRNLHVRFLPTVKDDCNYI